MKKQHQRRAMIISARSRLLLLIGFFGATFLVAGSVSAFSFSLPSGVVAASGTTHFDSLRVGTAGHGGVTFFNGSIVNESGPMVVADDLRVDGVITRLDGEFNKPVTIADDLLVEGDVAADNLYTKSQVDDLIDGSGTDLSGYYTETEADALLDAKQDSLGTSDVTNSMLAGSILDSKLRQLTTANKVAGSAVEDVFVRNDGDDSTSGTLTAGNFSTVGALTAGSVLYTPTATSTTTEGRVYYDSDDDNLYVYDGSGWVDLTVQGGGGDLVSTNNLSDVDNASTSRTNLGLGTVATLDTGSSTGDAIVLEDVGGSAGLPVVDGSQLTGISGGSGTYDWAAQPAVYAEDQTQGNVDVTDWTDISDAIDGWGGDQALDSFSAINGGSVIKIDPVDAANMGQGIGMETGSGDFVYAARIGYSLIGTDISVNSQFFQIHLFYSDTTTDVTASDWYGAGSYFSNSAFYSHYWGAYEHATDINYSSALSNSSYGRDNDSDVFLQRSGTDLTLWGSQEPGGTPTQLATATVSTNPGVVGIRVYYYAYGSADYDYRGYLKAFARLDNMPL